MYERINNYLTIFANLKKNMYICVHDAVLYKLGHM